MTDHGMERTLAGVPSAYHFPLRCFPPVPDTVVNEPMMVSVMLRMLGRHT
jgi:hypothetical protein